MNNDSNDSRIYANIDDNNANDDNHENANSHSLISDCNNGAGNYIKNSSRSKDNYHVGNNHDMVNNNNNFD